MKANVEQWEALAGLGETRPGAVQAPTGAGVGAISEGASGPGQQGATAWLWLRGGVGVREGRRAQCGCCGSLDVDAREPRAEDGRALDMPCGVWSGGLMFPGQWHLSPEPGLTWSEFWSSIPSTQNWAQWGQKPRFQFCDCVFGRPGNSGTAGSLTVETLGARSHVSWNPQKVHNTAASAGALSLLALLGTCPGGLGQAGHTGAPIPLLGLGTV